MTSYRIPFNRGTTAAASLQYVNEAIAGGHISGDGRFSRLCHRLLEEALPAHRVLLTTSCTHALEMAALLLDLAPGDEVIMPSFTFVSTANAFALRGARCVFGDIRPDTLNLDERQLERLITPRTKAIAVVHYAGVGCEMDSIMATAARHGLPVVEDNAHGLFGRYRGRHLGTFGPLATLSFHETKNFTSGEGGALIVNDAQYAERAEILREKGTNRSRFFRGEVDKYTWVGIGSSYLPSDMLAAYLYAQLAEHERVQAQRARAWDYYWRRLEPVSAAWGLRLPVVPAHCDQGYMMFYVLLDSLETRTRLIAHLKARGICATFHYLPLHLSEMGTQMGGRVGDCPVTEDVSDRLLRLPYFTDILEEELAEVVSEMEAFFAAP